jgi:anti-sigma factor RsiW
MTQLSDEILIAYADGELGDAQVHAVNGVLTADPETFARLRLLQPSRQRLVQAFQSMLLAERREQAAIRAAEVVAQPKDMSPPPMVRAERGSRLAPAAVAGVLLLALGGVVGYLAARVPPHGGAELANGSFWDETEVQAEKKRTEELIKTIPGGNNTAAIDERGAEGDGLAWYQQVALQHGKGADGWLSSLGNSNRNPELALFQLGNSGVAPDAVPDLNREELLFLGAESLAVNGQPYARLAYRDLRQGALGVGLYVGAGPDGSPSIERGSEQGLNYVHWAQGKRRYELIGAVPHWRLMVVAAAVQKQLGR